MYGKKEQTQKILIPEENIFRKYLGSFKLNKAISSPFRDDKNPSFVVYRNKNNKLRWIDYGTGDTGNYLDLIIKLYNCSISQAIEILKSEVKPLYKVSNAVIETELKVETSNKDIKVISREFNQGMDKVYWSNYYISESKLKEFDVIAVKYLFIDNDLIYTYSNKNPCYAFKMDDGIYKILFPYNNYKWINNCKSYHYQGYNQLPLSDDLLIITKSLKDVIVLSMFNISAIAPQSESQSIHNDFMDILKKRFTKIIMFYDNDIPGIKGADKICKHHNLNSIIIPIEYYEKYKIKDISDYIAKFGIDKTNNLINELLINE